MPRLSTESLVIGDHDDECLRCLMKLQPRFDKSSSDQHSKHSPHPSDLTQKSKGGRANPVDDERYPLNFS